MRGNVGSWKKFNAFLPWDIKDVLSKPIKLFVVIICLLILMLQYRLWFGDGSIQQNRIYQQRLDQLKVQVEEKRRRNEALYAEVLDLRKGKEAMEEQARYDLGMIKEDETFFQVIE